jgi:hypothetical protein
MTADFVRIGADIGGTFTDVVLETPNRRLTTKILTTHEAPERALLEAALGLLADLGLAPHQVTLIVHGTTLATNALIERRGARTGLLTTDGFRDVIEIGTEGRFDQYDLGIEKPPALVARPLRKGVPERMDVNGRVLLPLDPSAVLDAARFFAKEGVDSLAIAFLHSYANPAHEREAAALIRSVLRASIPSQAALTLYAANGGFQGLPVSTHWSCQRRSTGRRSRRRAATNQGTVASERRHPVEDRSPELRLREGQEVLHARPGGDQLSCSLKFIALGTTFLRPSWGVTSDDGLCN